MTFPALSGVVPKPTDHIVGMADIQLSRNRGDTLVTYALGSCLGITIWDPVAFVGGMLHVMLPTSSIDAEKAARNPAMFVDTGIPQLFRRSYELGAKKERIVLKVCGGAHSGTTEDDDPFQIGKRNFIALRKLLWKNNVLIQAHDVGGWQISRTMRLDVATGEVSMRINGKDSSL